MLKERFINLSQFNQRFIKKKTAKNVIFDLFLTKISILARMKINFLKSGAAKCSQIFLLLISISRRTWLEFRTCPLCRCATRCARSTFGRTRSTCYLRITIRNKLVTCELQLETNKSVCGRTRSACYLLITI